MVEKSLVEKSMVETSCKLLECGHFNPGHLNLRLFDHRFFNPIVVWGWGVHGCKVRGWEVRGWNLGLKSPRLECPATIEVYKNKDNSINIYFKLSYLTYVLIAIWSDITNALQKIFYHILGGTISQGIFDILSFEKKTLTKLFANLHIYALSFCRSKIILVGPICLGWVQIIFDRSKL